MATAEVHPPPFSATTLENARKAKVSTENFYDNLSVQDRDRTNRYDKYIMANTPVYIYKCIYISVYIYIRWKKLEQSMAELGLSEEEVSYNNISYSLLLCV